MDKSIDSLDVITNTGGFSEEHSNDSVKTEVSESARPVQTIIVGDWWISRIFEWMQS